MRPAADLDALATRLPVRRPRRPARTLARALAAVVAVAAVTAVVSAVVSVMRGDDGIAWRVEDPGGAGRLVTGGDMVCAAHEGLLCLDPADGTELFRLRDRSEADTLSIEDGALLVAADDELVAYGRDGAEMWATPMYTPAPAPPVADGVVLTTPDLHDTLRAVDLPTGDVLWEWSLGDWSVPAGLPGDALTFLNALRATDGVWFYVTLTVAGPTVEDGRTTYLVALDPRSGAERWRTAVATAAYADLNDPLVLEAVALDDATTAMALGAGPRGRLVGVERATGAIAWEEPLEGHAAVAGVDGRAIVLDGDGLRAYTADGRQAWATTAPGQPAADWGEANVQSGDLMTGGGRLYVNTTGTWAVDPRSGEAITILENAVDQVVALIGDHLVVADHACCQQPSQIQAHELPA